ncbi:hypothetical protein ACFRFQ_26780 [Rhodococcus sp. NPDC056743]|uniref:hypothetical protein n=1 Tax=Rhodococcus sp. NPDC056743 TaxID=3345934 RepID=UPI0036727ED8
MDITEFVSARLDEQQEQAESVRASLAANPPAGVASYAQGFVDYYDKFRSYVSEALARLPEDRLNDLPLLYAATWFSHHPDYDAEWDWRFKER